MKINFNSDENLPLNKILKLHNLTIIVRSVFEEDDKYYPQVFLDEWLYEVVLQIVLIIILERSDLIHKILYLLKKY